MNSKRKIVVASPRYVFRSGLEAIFSKMGFTVLLNINSQDDLERSIVKENPELVFIDNKDGLFKIEKTIAGTRDNKNGYHTSISFRYSTKELPLKSIIVNDQPRLIFSNIDNLF